MGKIKLIPVLLLLSTLSFAKVITIEKIVAYVNDSVITLSEVEHFQKTLEKYEGKSLDKKDTLDLLIERELLFQLVKEYNIEVSDEEIRAEVKKLIDTKKYSEKEKDFLRYNIKLKKNTESLVKHIVKKNLVSTANDELIFQVYEENKENFYEKEKLLVAHILVNLSREDSYEELENKEKLVRKLLSFIKDKKEKFASLAKKYSDDVNTKYKGGIIGWHDIDSLSQIQADIASATLDLKIGQTSDIIISASGYHIIKLVDKKEERQISFYEAKSYIANNILRQRANLYLLKMVDTKRKKSYIENYL